MVIRNKIYTIAEFEDFINQNRNRLYELIHGEIVEKVPTQEHGIIAARIATRLTLFVDDNELGFVAVEARHRPLDDDYNDRLPDVSFTAGTAKPVVKQGAVAAMPELAVEIKSPDDTYRQMRETADFYIANGCKTVWLVFAERKTIEVHRLNEAPVTLTVDDTLSGSDTLAGFSLAISPLFKGLD